ncbi:hypothetical protein IFM89_015779 [Coptis chinensis]|uniref:40S ribosomal protein S21 n=1 Tax=Coptis chinensis TaxID=261450 RepID=A0A835IRG2_9MAGN|nr:hypothetical protein IFM89_015779 [Coptis chinensis]
MQNEEGFNTDLYIPRKCSATNRLITSKDHASVQINVGHLDVDGLYTGKFSTFALCGYVRAQCPLIGSDYNYDMYKQLVGHQEEVLIAVLMRYFVFRKEEFGELDDTEGDADSAVDRLWQKKKVEVGQQ